MSIAAVILLCAAILIGWMANRPCTVLTMKGTSE